LLTKFKKLNRNTQLIIILALILIVVTTLVLLFTGSKSTDTPKPTTNDTTEITPSESKTARVSRIDGTLQLKQEDGQWQDVATEAELTETSVLRTVGATSRAVIIFEDASELRIDANSEVELYTITDKRIVIKQYNGYTYNRLTDNPNRSYVLESGEAQYEALGTAFRVIASGDEEAVEVYESSVHETSTNKRPAEGERLIVLSKARPAESNTLRKIDIETIKTDPFILWNKNIDQASELFKNSLGFLKDFDAPELTISSPADNEVILLEPDAEEGIVEITGKTERNAQVTVQSKSQTGSQPVTVTVNESGDFKTPVLTAPLGSSVFTFIVKDRVGNIKELSVRYTFQRKSAPITTGALLLTAEKKGNKVELNWTTSGSLTTPDGVQVVYGTTTSPTYGTATATLVKGNSKTLQTSDLPNGTIYFRVCAYNASASTCSPYSNQVSVTLD
jgi:hypothetical protein